jgi:hypothetical protein
MFSACTLEVEDSPKHILGQAGFPKQACAFVNIFLKAKLKVVYEVSRWEGYFKKRLRENVPT